MKKIIVSALLLIFMVSCEKKETETLDQNYIEDSLAMIPDITEPVESSTLQTCYMEGKGKDSVFVSLEDNLGTIIGKMRYKNFEKDSSLGDVIGSQNGDTLKLVYTFESEGSVSEREIYFLRKGSDLIEGIGDQQSEGKVSKYSEPGKLKYEGHTLTQVDCTDFDQKFKSK